MITQNLDLFLSQDDHRLTDVDWGLELPTSYRQAFFYQNNEHMNASLKILARQKSIVTPAEIQELSSILIDVCEGRKLILQLGDCAERFTDCRPDQILKKFQHAQVLQAQLESGLKKPAVVVARMAGQYAKPRSETVEWSEQLKMALPVYRGDIYHREEPSIIARTPDANRFLQAYHCSYLIKAFLRGMRFSQHQKLLYTCHEVLHLPYETHLTQQKGQDIFAGSAEFLWVGERTRNLDGPHMSYAKQILNPIAVKIGPECSPQTLINTIRYLNPLETKGRLSIILRLGHKEVLSKLPLLLKSVNTSSDAIIWILDPMHGNTEKQNISNKKTNKNRYLTDILSEIKDTITVFRKFDFKLGGIHLETSGLDDGYECFDSRESQTVLGQELKSLSACDPRLNCKQAEIVIQEFVESLKL